MSDKKYKKPVLKSEKMFEKTVLACAKGPDARTCAASVNMS